MNSPIIICSSILVLFIIVVAIQIIRAKNKKTTLIYPFGAGGMGQIEVIIKGVKWDEICVWFEGQQAGIFRRKPLYTGQDLQLSDGSLLNLNLSRNQFQPERLKISRNGQPIHRIVTEAMQQVQVDYASNGMYFIGFFSMGMGIASLFTRFKILEPLSFGWPTILLGLLFVVLGFFTRRRSMPALIIAIVIYALDGLIGLLIILSALSTGSYILIGNPFMHLVLLMVMVNGIDGINAIHHKPKSRIIEFFNISVAAIMVLSLCAISMTIIYLMLQMGSLLTPGSAAPPTPVVLGWLLNQGSPAQPTPQVLEPVGDLCTLTIKDPSVTVNMRDLADATAGKRVDYLDGSDTASVLGMDGGNWWYIEVTHRGKTSRGWVFSNLVDLGNSASCSSIQSIATPFP
jgi:hypothetical protein